jgi:hypothetical protein
MAATCEDEFTMEVTPDKNLFADGGKMYRKHDEGGVAAPLGGLLKNLEKSRRWRNDTRYKCGVTSRACARTVYVPENFEDNFSKAV